MRAKPMPLEVGGWCAIRYASSGGWRIVLFRCETTCVLAGYGVYGLGGGSDMQG